MERKHRFRAALAAGIGLAGGLAVACVDLFHSTDFPTLCETNPSDPQCPEGGADGMVPSQDASVDQKIPHDFCKSYPDPNMVLDRATRACAHLGACLGALDNKVDTSSLASTAFGPCVIAAQLAFDCTANPQLRPSGASDDFWACVDAAKNCGDIKHCAFPTDGDQACGGGKTSSSGPFYACATHDPTQIACLVQTKQLPFGAVPCAMTGQTCGRDDPVDGSQSICGGPQGAHCATSQCMGTFASDCRMSLDYGVDCAQQSATCTTGSAGTPQCKPSATNATTCTTSGDPASCVDGGSVVSICVDGREATIDCSRLGDTSASGGLGCDTTTPPPGYAISGACVGPATGTCTEGCVDTTIFGCGRGQSLHVDCRSAGLMGGCTDGGASTPAHCATPTDDTIAF